MQKMLGEYQQQLKKLEQKDSWGPGWKEMSSWKCIMSVQGKDRERVKIGKTWENQTGTNVQERSIILQTSYNLGNEQKTISSKNSWLFEGPGS